jgi:hypothetical protein
VSNLYPTPTRLALLREVAAGNVIEGITEETDGHTWLVDPETGDRRKVCARIEEALKAGWVVQDEAFWRLTRTGRAVLDGAP